MAELGVVPPPQATHFHCHFVPDLKATAVCLHHHDAFYFSFLPWCGDARTAALTVLTRNTADVLRPGRGWKVERRSMVLFESPSWENPGSDLSAFSVLREWQHVKFTCHFRVSYVQLFYSTIKKEAEDPGCLTCFDHFKTHIMKHKELCTWKSYSILTFYLKY